MSGAKSSDRNPSINQKEQEWEEKKLAALLEAASIAIKRARYVFIIINIMAILIFSAEFNAIFPWLRHSIGRAPSEIRALLNDVLYRDLQIVSVPLLNIKFSAFDLTFIGSLAAMLLAIWFYYCVRAEHLVVKEIYKISKDSRYAQKRAYLYHGIAHYFVYTTASKREEPEGATSQITARAVIKALYFVPAWLPLLILAFDSFSLIQPVRVISNTGCATLWCVLVAYNQHVEIILRALFAIAFILISLSQCWGAYRWDKATRTLVGKLQEQIEDDAKDTLQE